MSILVFDLETTGLNSTKNTIVSIAAKLFDSNRNIITSYTTDCFNPDGEINLQALLINRFTLSRLSNLKTEKEALFGFCDWLLSLPRTEEIIIAGHNVSFDLDFIKKRLLSSNIEGFDQVASYRVIDTAGWGRLLALSGILPSNTKVSLSGLVKVLNIPYDETKHHGASYDVDLTAQVIFSIIDLLRNKNEIL